MLRTAFSRATSTPYTRISELGMNLSFRVIILKRLKDVEEEERALLLLLLFFLLPAMGFLGPNHFSKRTPMRNNWCLDKIYFRGKTIIRNKKLFYKHKRVKVIKSYVNSTHTNTPILKLWNKNWYNQNKKDLNNILFRDFNIPVSKLM